MKATKLSSWVAPIFVGMIYLFLYIPIITLVVFSFNDGNFASGWQGFSFRWYVEMFNSSEILSALEASLIVATCSTILSILLSLGFVLAGKWLPVRKYEVIFYGNVMIPDIVLGIGLLCLFAALSLPLGYRSLIVGHTVVGLGFALPILSARYHQIDPFLTEASLDLGATHWQTIWRVIIPLLVPAIIAASLLVFTLSLDDFVISYFCSGPQIETLSVYVFNQIKNLVDPTINALSTCLLIVSSLGVMILAYFKLLDQVVQGE